ncbi:GAF domain-containing protein [Fulvivirga lutimaris]|uniref:GAF domain-containing protein n=1 Tax=Fulvivirga lutimaris TaxID=1819566 RepID=UPI0012BC75CC|nr:GAF domain-containing protein [Fulvivirga lutimaris]MTI40783.1 PAS domain S-box protein [Fulvivirga lutimaris]
MRKMKLKIGNKIFGGFLILIVLFVFNAAVIFVTSNSIDTVVKKSSDIIRPSKEAISDFKLLVTQSKMLIINWVYVQSNVDDKDALRVLHDQDYPALKERILELESSWENDSQRFLMDTVRTEFEALLVVEQEVMGQLVTFENYEDPLTKLLAEDAIESQVIPMTASIISKLDEVARMQQETTQESDDDLIAATNQLINITIILGAIIILIGLLSAYFMAKSITVPINYIKDIVVKLGKGELVDDQGRKFNNDEIGEMATAMDNLIRGLRSTTIFAENIGNGKYDSEFKPLSDHDVLGNALLEMRSNLSRVAEEDQKRNWSTEGLAKFGDILRRNNDNLEKLSDDIIRSLVTYMGCNQGGIYIIDDTEESEPYMSLLACYAWDKKKYIDQKIHKGEGLAGQVWQEMDTIYLTEVPDNYIKITSGLGDANPKSVLIVPLKVNEEIYGVVEIASFKVFEDYEVEFVQKIAESIASTVSSVKINAKTQKLLEESQEMTEQMRSQEEEMRQNMEELQATQEEMQRGQAEAESTMEAINSSVAMIEFDADGYVINANQNFLDITGYFKDEILGESHRLFVNKEDKTSDTYKQFWKDLTLGIAKYGEFERVGKGGKVIQLVESYAPIKSRDGAVGKIMMVAVDVSKYTASA